MVFDTRVILQLSSDLLHRESQSVVKLPFIKLKSGLNFTQVLVWHQAFPHHMEFLCESPMHEAYGAWKHLCYQLLLRQHKSFFRRISYIYLWLFLCFLWFAPLQLSLSSRCQRLWQSGAPEIPPKSEKSRHIGFSAQQTPLLMGVAQLSPVSEVLRMASSNYAFH